MEVSPAKKERLAQRNRDIQVRLTTVINPFVSQISNLYYVESTTRRPVKTQSHSLN